MVMLINLMNYLVFILLCVDRMQTIRWTSSGLTNNTETLISLMSTSQAPSVDIFRGEQFVILRDIKSYSHAINIYCFVAGYNENSKIIYSFCKDNHCFAEFKDGEVSAYSRLTGMNIKANTRFTDTKGIKLEIKLLPSDTDVSGSYYCSVIDNFSHSTIRSNNIEIRDVFYWREKLVLNKDNIKKTYSTVISRTDLPVTFSCNDGDLTLNPLRPNWIHQEIISPVMWSICPVKKNLDDLKVKDKVSFERCTEYTMTKWPDSDTTLQPKDVSEMVDWKYIVNQQGQLILFNFDHRSINPDLSYALMCYRKYRGSAISIATYIQHYENENIISGVIFDGTSANTHTKLMSKSPLVQHVDIYSRKIPKDLINEKLQSISIYAKYLAPPNVETYWLHNGNQLNDRIGRKIDQYKVTFFGDITSDMGGYYNLVVKHQSEVLNFTIVVRVLGPPKLINPDCLPLIRHVWENENASFSCKYEDNPDALTVKINNQDIVKNGQVIYSVTNLQMHYPYLNELRFNVSFSNDSLAKIITGTYNVYNLRKTLGQIVYQDHSVTFVAQNKFGLDVKSTSIYTVPRVASKMEKYPDIFNCTDSCSSALSHQFMCMFTMSEYSNKELDIEHYWTINGHRLDRIDDLKNVFAPYFIVDPVMKNLTMKPIVSNNTKRDEFVKKALKSNFIVCHIEIYSSAESVPKFMYQSMNDNELKKRLQAKVMIDHDPIVKQGYIYWVIPLILVLVLILIVIFIIRKMRQTGVTYQLEQLVKKVRHDREKENLEQIIGHYEHENEYELSQHSNDSDKYEELNNYPSDADNNGTFLRNQNYY